MNTQPVIRAVWEGPLPMAALDGHLSLSRPHCHTLAVLQLADSKGAISVDDVNTCLLGGLRRQIARRMIEQAHRDKLLVEDGGKYVLSDWGLSSLKEDKRAWVEHSAGSWMFLMAEGLSPLMEAFPVIPIAPVDERSAASQWSPLSLQSARRFPALSRLLASIESGHAFDGYLLGDSERLLICPSSSPPKTLVRTVKATLDVEFQAKEGWRIVAADFAGGAAIQQKMASGLLRQKFDGKPPAYFASYLKSAGLVPADGGRYLSDGSISEGTSFDMRRLRFISLFKAQSWSVRFEGSLAAPSEHQALRWYVEHAIDFKGVPTGDDLVRQARRYVHLAGVNPDGVDLGALRAAFAEVTPLGLGRADFSRLMHCLYF